MTELKPLTTVKYTTDILQKLVEKEHWSAEDAMFLLNGIPDADVAPRAEVFEEVDKFRADLMDKFIDLCRGNDYNKLTLLKIGDVVDEMYDRRIAELKKKYTEGQK